jgi:pyrimidine-nucleoside phosphorylase
MTFSAGITKTLEEAKRQLLEQIKNGKAHDKQYAFIKAQGGNLPPLDQFISVKETIEIPALTSGYIEDIDALAIGIGAMKLGAGRETKEDDIDPNVGIIVHKKVGDSIEKGESLATLYNNLDNTSDIEKDVLNAFKITKEPVEKKPIIFEIISEKDL